MELNYSCIRATLLYLEKELDYSEDADILKGIHNSISYIQVMENEKLSKKYSQKEILYSLETLHDSKFINALFKRGGNDAHIVFFIINDITKAGNDLLNNIRDDGVFKEVKSKVSKVAGASLNIFAQVAGTVSAEYTKQMLGLNGIQ